MGNMIFVIRTNKDRKLNMVKSNIYIATKGIDKLLVSKFDSLIKHSSFRKYLKAKLGVVIRKHYVLLTRISRMKSCMLLQVVI